MKRPVGITFLAILSFVFGALYLVSGMGMLASSPENLTRLGPLARYGASAGWLLLLIGIVDLAAGYGLWTLRSWGWTLMVVLVAMNLAIATGTLISGAATVGALLSLAINGFIMWYLLRRDVKIAFVATDVQEGRLDRVA